MDNSTTTNTNTNNATVLKTPEAESHTPTKIQPLRPSPFTNGVLKRHAPLHHPVVVTYKECLKNHAAAIGGHALDGCGEFMPSPASNPAEPTSLKCAACDCHRNFHRREPDDPPIAAPALEYQPHHRHHPLPPVSAANRRNSSSSPNNSPSPPPISSSYYPSAPHMLLALSHGLSAPPPDGNAPMPLAVNASSAPPLISSSPNGRKRFRTRFTQEQKGKMFEFAERIDWKMQKKDEDSISEFCAETGIERGVFKVWMHNNKNTLGKKDQQPHLANSIMNTDKSPNANGIGYGSIGGSSGGAAPSSAVHFHHHHHQQHESNNIHGQDLSHGAHVLGTNGSSSSS